MRLNFFRAGDSIIIIVSTENNHDENKDENKDENENEFAEATYKIIISNQIISHKNEEIDQQ